MLLRGLASPFLPVRNAAASDEPQGGNAPEAACVLPGVSKPKWLG